MSQNKKNTGYKKKKKRKRKNSSSYNKKINEKTKDKIVVSNNKSSLKNKNIKKNVFEVIDSKRKDDGIDKKRLKKDLSLKKREDSCKINKVNKDKLNINNRYLYVLMLFIIVLFLVGGYTRIKKNDQEKHMLEVKLNEIKNSYNDIVITKRDALIYKKDNNKYVDVGKISKDVFLYLDSKEIDYDNGYFVIDKTNELGEDKYYIYYEDIDKVDYEIDIDNRYLNYIPYNKNIITKDSFSLYDQDNNLIYRFNDKVEMSIIVNKDNFYGIIFGNRLLYIKNKDIDRIVDSSNTTFKNTSGIAVLNYHFVYNDSVDTCNQIICHTERQFQNHLEYIKNNNIFTPTLRELEMYIDGHIQLPKSVVITIDDGWHTEESSKLLNKYQLNGTVFLITSEYDKNAIESKYVEVHSHTHNMHRVGDCPYGYGGGIKCLSEEYIQNDLKKSRERLNNTTYFCYPFYEYNDYSIAQLKKAGFTMAFAGENANKRKKASPGIDKFQVPRYVISNTTSVNEIKSMIG